MEKEKYGKDGQDGIGWWVWYEGRNGEWDGSMNVGVTVC